MLRCFLVTVRVVKCELMILNILGYAIDLNLGLVNINLRIGATNGINLSLLDFFAKQGSFPDANANLHGVSLHMIDGSVDVCSLFSNHVVEVAVNHAAGRLVTSLPFHFSVFHALQFGAAFFALLLQLFDVVQHVAATFAFVSLHFLYY